ncbi:MAG: hypothetical protein AAB575_04270 [Patescibacteria group bacterium]
MKFLIVLVAFISCLVLSCKLTDVTDDRAVSAQTIETKTIETSVVVVAFDNDWKPKMCWKKLDGWNISEQGGGIYMYEWSGGKYKSFFVNGNVMWVIGLPLGEAAEALGINSTFCVGGRYVEK